QKHGRADVMNAGLDVPFDLVEQIARAAIPQMMVRIDDWHRRIDRILAALCEPVFVDGEEDLLLHLGFADLDGHHSPLARGLLRARLRSSIAPIGSFTSSISLKRRTIYRASAGAKSQRLGCPELARVSRRIFTWVSSCIGVFPQARS